MRPCRLLALMIITAAGACAPALPPALAERPGVEEQIIAHYDFWAQESGASCPQVQLVQIIDARVVAETPSELQLAVGYAFQPRGWSARGSSLSLSSMLCQGTATRVFTFRKTEGGLVLAGMSGTTRRS